MFFSISFVFSLLFSIQSFAQFDSLKCGDNISEALIGKKFPNQTSASLEKKYSKINLKNLGGDGEPGDSYALSFWQICDDQFALIENQSKKTHVISDVVLIPKDLQNYPTSLPGTTCKQNDIKLEGDILAILDKDSSLEKQPVKVAWKIDKVKLHFTKIDSKSMFCDKN